MEEQKRKRGRPVEHNKVLCLTNGEVYSSCTDAAKKLNCYREKVYAVATGIQRTHHGLKFRFLDD